MEQLIWDSSYSENNEYFFALLHPGQGQHTYYIAIIAERWKEDTVFWNKGLSNDKTLV